MYSIIINIYNSYIFTQQRMSSACTWIRHNYFLLVLTSSFTCCYSSRIHTDRL